MTRIGIRFWRTIEHWNRVDGSLLAAAVSFYASLSTFPLIMVLLSVFGFCLRFTGFGRNFETQVLQFVSDQSSDELAAHIGALLNQVETNAFFSGPLGLLFLLMLSMAMFVNFERAFAKIWDTQEEPHGILRNIGRIVLHRLRAFVMLMVVAVLILCNFFSHMAIHYIATYMRDFGFSKNWWWIAHVGSAIAVNTVLFTIINRTLPTVPVTWKRALQGGLFTAITWELGRFLLALLVISDKYDAFGVVGVFMGLLLWTFYASSVILMGAAFVRVAEIPPEKRKPPQVADAHRDNPKEPTSEESPAPKPPLTSRADSNSENS